MVCFGPFQIQITWEMYSIETDSVHERVNRTVSWCMPDWRAGNRLHMHTIIHIICNDSRVISHSVSNYSRTTLIGVYKHSFNKANECIGVMMSVNPGPLEGDLRNNVIESLASRQAQYNPFSAMEGVPWTTIASGSISRRICIWSCQIRRFCWSCDLTCASHFQTRSLSVTQA
jgi:hypothetical protein